MICLRTDHGALNRVILFNHCKGFPFIFNLYLMFPLNRTNHHALFKFHDNNTPSIVYCLISVLLTKPVSIEIFNSH